MPQKYYIGLDVGTNSVGYAVTDEKYNLLKFKNEPMWGTHVFEGAAESAGRRANRTGRRRLHRRQQRVLLTQGIFAEEIAKTDERFFIRLHEAALYRDEAAKTDANILFNDADFHDKDYYEKYPTIHHLLTDFMKDAVPYDKRYARLLYIAVGWLMAHRGHFLSDVDKDNVKEALDFKKVYREFLDLMTQNGLQPWDNSENVLQELQNILLSNKGKRDKEKSLVALLYGGKKPKTEEDDAVNEGKLLSLLAGCEVKIKDLFPGGEYETEDKISFHDAEDKIEAALAILGDDAEWILRARKLYDWSLLHELFGGYNSVSEGKVAIYRQHGEDLANLKKFIRRYLPNKYGEMFRYMTGEKEKNYVAYSYHTKGMTGTLPKQKATQQEFCDNLKKIFKNITPTAEDKELYESITARLENGTFMPKQVSGDNRVIPYQVYYDELKQILGHAKKYLSFLTEKDADGFTGEDKLIKVFLFRIPYFVGPLHFPADEKQKSEFAWAMRKKDEIVRPWNFNHVIDLDKSEEEFIRRMTNTCTYLAGEHVLPKCSLLYEKFEVLNEINNLKVGDTPIPVEVKQQIYQELFAGNKNGRKVTKKNIRDFLQSNNYIYIEGGKGDEIFGVDQNINARLKSHAYFARLMERKLLQQKDAEKIIERLAYSEDKRRIRAWLKQEFTGLTEEDIRYIANFNGKDFGKLSEKFLSGFYGVNKETGEKNTIIGFLWETNDNLMKLLSERYTFGEDAEKFSQEYYAEHPKSLDERMDDMRLSKPVKRAVYRTLDIVKDVVKARKQPPSRIFIEMAREDKDDQKGKRTQSRYNSLKSAYDLILKDKTAGEQLQKDVREVSAQLAKYEGDDSPLKSEVLFLYFLQLGKSMYSGKPINIEDLKNDKLYNVDHIYPRSKVKDDSINNKVLVTSKENGDKGDRFPIDGKIRQNMAALWLHYKNSNLISEEKYKRLMRSTEFTEEELWGFINRQIVETRQSTKALTVILKELYPDTKIIFSKAGLVSDFRHEFDIPKSRSVNDFHHAKDAYLNIVVGNVYYSRFQRQYFNPNRDKYSVKLKTLFENKVTVGKEEAWRGKEDVGRIKRTTEKNNVHYTRFAVIKQGGLFDEQPVKKDKGLIPLKQGLDTERYGGYNKPAASFYLLARYTLAAKKQEKGLMLVPVELLSKNEVLSSEAAAQEYVLNMIGQIIKKDIALLTDISFPLGQRPIKINTMFSFDGYRATLSGKSNGGQQVLFKSAMNLCVDCKKESYIKHLESFIYKYQNKDKNIEPNEKYDKITHDENMELYDFFCEKITSPLFQKAAFANQKDTLIGGREKFAQLSLKEQILALNNILSVFKAGRSGGCDLTLIGGSNKAGAFTISSNLQNMAKKYSDVRIIEMSASGLYESKSKNLLEFL